MGTLELLTLIFGCFSEPDPLKKARYYLEDSPGEATQFIHGLPPEEQIYVVTQLAEETPQKIMPLCEVLADGTAKRRCKRIATRPHLWSIPEADEIPPVRSKDCPHPHQCAADKASLAIAQMDWEGAARACQTISTPKWRDECLFYTSEELLKRDLAQYKPSLEICASLSQFQKNCEQHGVFFYAKTLYEQKLNWSGLRIQTDRFHEIWKEYRPEDSDRVLSHLWAQVVVRRYEEKGSIDPDTPTDLIVYMRSIHALRSLQHLEEIPSDLEELAKAIQSGTVKRSREKPIGMETRFNLWTGVAPEYSISYLGHSLRLYDEDPQIDYLIALLEAVARLRPPNTSLLVPYVEHPHPKVARTAKRILSFDIEDTSLLLESFF